MRTSKRTASPPTWSSRPPGEWMWECSTSTAHARTSTGSRPRRTRSRRWGCFASELRSLVGKEELVPVGVGDENRVVAPPSCLRRNRAFGDLPTELSQCLWIQLDEQTPSVSSRGIMAQDDLALSAVDLADRLFVPRFLESELIEVEAERSLDVGYEEYGSRVPLVGNLGLSGWLVHARILHRAT